jgi:hypothetical protein
MVRTAWRALRRREGAPQLGAARTDVRRLVVSGARHFAEISAKFGRTASRRIAKRRSRRRQADGAAAGRPLVIAAYAAAMNIASDLRLHRLPLPPEQREQQPFVLDAATMQVIAPWPVQRPQPGDEARLDAMLARLDFSDLPAPVCRTWPIARRCRCAERRRGGCCTGRGGRRSTR